MARGEHRASAILAAYQRLPQWRLSTLPRYISADDISSCSIASRAWRQPCRYVRDRAISSLRSWHVWLMRAGDIVGLRLGDIDWDRSSTAISMISG